MNPELPTYEEPARVEYNTGLDDASFVELVHGIGQRRSGSSHAGRVRILSLAEQVGLTLILVRHNPTQMLLARWFGVSQATVSRVYRQMMPDLREVLRRVTPDLREATEDRIVLVDGTDMPTGNRAGHDHNYSGKRHRQGLSIQVASDISGRLLGVSSALPGCIHDRLAFTRTRWEYLLRDRTVIGDPAYQGSHAITPRKKPKGGELSHGDKRNNKRISATRSAVERCIGHLKNWKILANGYRGRLRELPKVIKIVTSLEFYRLGWHP